MKLIASVIFVIIGILNVARCGEYSKVNGSVYYVSYPLRLNWYQAYRFCSTMGMYLVDVRTEMEYDRILQLIENFNENNNLAENKPGFWTSGTDLGSEGHFYWMTTGQSILYSNWGSDSPDNSINENFNGETDNCVLFSAIKDYKWNDGTCSGLEPFICRDTFDIANYKSFANSCESECESN